MVKISAVEKPQKCTLSFHWSPGWGIGLLALDRNPLGVVDDGVHEHITSTDASTR